VCRRCCFEVHISAHGWPSNQRNDWHLLLGATIVQHKVGIPLKAKWKFQPQLSFVISCFDKPPTEVRGCPISRWLGCVQSFTVRNQWREGWLLKGHQDAPFPHQDVVTGSLLSIVLGLMSLVCGAAPNLAGFTPNVHCHTNLDGGLQKYEITRYGAYILPSVSQKCAIDGQV
jgi:hypothetical protein